MSKHQIEIIISNKNWKKKIPEAEKICQESCVSALKYEKIKGAKEVSILLADDKKLQELNHDFRGKDKPTNVLSFPGDGEMLGDIAISLDTLLKEAKSQNKTPENHLSHLVVHATLHLLGHDHEDDEEAEEMEKKEITILLNMGIKNPYKY